ncbi:hypothetical protein QFZ66_002099 [Streptomyces sp. B4I13]|nr:hypothetical protein [Streptomyces sp. B4I13]
MVSRRRSACSRHPLPEARHHGACPPAGRALVLRRPDHCVTTGTPPAPSATRTRLLGTGAYFATTTEAESALPSGETAYCGLRSELARAAQSGERAHRVRVGGAARPPVVMAGF